MSRTRLRAVMLPANRVSPATDLRAYGERARRGTARVRGYYDVHPDRESSLTLDVTSRNRLGDPMPEIPEQAASPRARAELLQKIGARLKNHDWTQAEAASRCGVTQPRINDLLRGRVSRFPLDALVNIATALGCRVRVELDAA